MLSVSNLLCGHCAGNERLRYGHKTGASASRGVHDPRPVVVWALTRACNLRCVHCYASAHPEPAPGELTTEEARALLRDLHEYRVPAVLFSGGEPLVRPDFFELLAYARDLGVRVTVSTNGTLIDRSCAKKLATHGLAYAGISIDGSPSTHDRLRGAKGAYDRTLEGVDHCRSQGIKVGIRFTVHGLNLHDLDAVIDLCIERGVDRLCVYHLAYAGRGKPMQQRDLTPEQTRSVVARIFKRTEQLHASGIPLEVLTVSNHADAAFLLLELERRSEPERLQHAWERLRGTGGNQSGNFIASIGPCGDVHYDQFSWHYTCGNVRKQVFSTLWSNAVDPRLKVLRDRTAYLPERCRGCRFLDVCNGNLRTRAEAATGNWLGADPSCYLSDQEIRPS